jgi:hypothetical protein
VVLSEAEGGSGGGFEDGTLSREEEGYLATW